MEEEVAKIWLMRNILSKVIEAHEENRVFNIDFAKFKKKFSYRLTVISWQFARTRESSQDTSDIIWQRMCRTLIKGRFELSMNIWINSIFLQWRHATGGWRAGDGSYLHPFLPSIPRGWGGVDFQYMKIYYCCFIQWTL